MHDVDTTLERVRQNFGTIDLNRVQRPDGAGCYARLIDPDGNIIGICAGS